MRSVALDVGVGRDNHLNGLVRLGSVHEFGHTLLVGADTFQRRNNAHKDVIDAVEFAGAFYERNVGRRLHDADEAAVTRIVGAYAAPLPFGQTTAFPARMYVLFYFVEQAREVLDVPFGCFQEGISQPLGGFTPNARHLG
jgi:hypothetical protein